jgi:protoporphyrinogen oxidase
MHIVIIGGGFAGVAAAATLRAQGADATILDERRTLGGRARSDDLAGSTIDTGAQLIAASFTRTVRLLTLDAPATSALAADAPLHRVAGRDAYVHDGVRHPLQFGSIRSLLAFGGLSALEKVKLARHLVPALAVHHAALDADASRVPASLDHESARAFMSARVGETAADVLVEPPLNGFYATLGSEASLAFYLMLGRYGSDGDVLAPTAGWSRALEHAVRGATVELGARIDACEVHPDGVTVRDTQARTWRADGAIIATGPRTAARLLAPHLEAGNELVHWLARVEMRPTWTVALAVGVAPERDAFGVFRAARPGHLVSACAIHGAKMTSPPRERDVVLAWPTPEGVRRLHGSAPEQIVDAMLPEIESLVPQIRGRVERARVYRFEEGTPVAHPGFGADRAHARALADRIALPIALAGDYLTTPLIEGAVASGERAAKLLAARLRSQSQSAPLDF